MVQCKINREMDCDSDHLPIVLVIDWSWQHAKPTRKCLWSRTNVEILWRTVVAHLPHLNSILELKENMDINKLVDSIINALDAGIAASTSWSNPSPHSVIRFDQKCKNICTEVQQLH